MDIHTAVDGVVQNVARHAVWIAGSLLVVSLGCWGVKTIQEETASESGSPGASPVDPLITMKL